MTVILDVELASFFRSMRNSQRTGPDVLGPLENGARSSGLGIPSCLAVSFLRSDALFAQELEEGDATDRVAPLVTLNLSLMREKAELLKRLQVHADPRKALGTGLTECV